MSLVQQMENEMDCVEVIFHDYIQSKGHYKIFFFFEGRDDFNFYWCRLSPYVVNKEKYKQYICQSKKNVFWLNRKINDSTIKTSDEVICYFADNDFDKERALCDEIYVTPTYSIENFYVTKNAIENMIIGALGFSGEMDNDDEEDFNDAVEYLLQKRNDIIDSMIYANAWYSLQHNKAKDSPSYPKLSALKEYHVISEITDKEKLKELVPGALDVSDEEINEEIQYLRENPVGRLRGKYFEQTMPKYIMTLFQDANKKKGRFLFRKRRKVVLNVSKDSMIYILTNYADVPADLFGYIRARFKSKF